MFFRNAACGLFSSDRVLFISVFRIAVCFFFRFPDRGWIVICFSGLGYVFLRFFGLWYVFFDWIMFISVFRTAAELQYVFLDWVMFFPLFLVCGMFFSDRS